MRFTDAIGLRRIPTPAGRRKPRHPDEEQPHAEVLLHGRPTGRVLKAVRLEQALEVPGGYLLFTTEDVPFEEALGIVLLSPDCLQILDKAAIGLCYHTGTFQAPRLLGGDRVRFRFMGDYEWQVRLLASPGWRVPGIADTGPVWRRFGFRRRFVVSRTALQSGADAAT